MYQDLLHKKNKLAVIGLGYVGLPVALEFAKKFSVVGFDINKGRIQLLKQGIDPSHELDKDNFEDRDIEFTDDIEILRIANFYIVAVPTSVAENKMPDLTSLRRACETVGNVIKKGDYVVFESTVYPGCTDEACLPIVEKISGLKNIIDFKTGYSPERINPGDKAHTLRDIIKVVSGCDEESLEVIAKVYELVVDAGVYKAPSIKVAEASKVIENTQRDVNIALMNELSMMLEKMGINTFDVLKAAGTKWNFLNFQPGLVGGHCIGVAPNFLTYKSKELGYDSKLIPAGRALNESMASHIATKILQHIVLHNQNIQTAKVLVMGVTFKEDVSDIRNSKVAEIVKELQSHSLSVHVTDPFANSDQLKHEYGFELTDNLAADYDAVIIAVPHNNFKKITDTEFASITKSHAIIADVKGIFRGAITSRTYWSL
jgi:UDP-N-acetyl-D-galactosamine dehydrogenase